MLRKPLLMIVPVLTGMCLVATTASAESDADAAIAYRKSVMQVMGSHLKAIAAVTKGSVPLVENLPLHTDGLASATGIALKTFSVRVTEGREERTTAKPDLWSDFDRFAQAMRKTETDTAALKTAVAANDRSAIAAQLAAVGKDCKSCHDDTRTK